MTHRVESSPPLPDPFLEQVSTHLLPVDGWGSFRPGAKPAAVAAILYRREGAWHVPFVARRGDLPTHPGQVGLPGGGVEDGEEAWAAAAREVQEEVGVPASGLVPLGAGPPLYAAVSNFCVVPFVAWLPSEGVRFVPQPSEVDEVLEVPLALLLDPTAWRDGGAYPGPHLPFQATRIWGLTARILGDLLPVMERALDDGLTSRAPDPPPASSGR
jgi:8-oxo-dGTP pyrophosphatase MutT (NUDIX family)